KRCGHMEGKRIVPLEEYLPKLAAARRTGGPDFLITAGTDARAVAGLDGGGEGCAPVARGPARGRAARREHGRAGEDAAALGGGSRGRGLPARARARGAAPRPRPPAARAPRGARAPRSV